MSAPLPDPIEAAFREGAVRALRKRAAAQAKIANKGAVEAGDEFPGVIVRTGESAIAHRLAITLSLIADELDAEGSR